MAGRKREDPKKRPWSERDSPPEQESAPHEASEDDDNIVVAYPPRKDPDAMDVDTDEAAKKKKEKEGEKEKGPAPKKSKKVRTLWETYFPCLPEFATKASKRAAKKAKTTQPATDSTTDADLRPRAQSPAKLSDRTTSPSTTTQNPPTAASSSSDPLVQNAQTEQPAANLATDENVNLEAQSVTIPSNRTTDSSTHAGPDAHIHDTYLTNGASNPPTTVPVQDLHYNPSPPGGFEHPGTEQRLEEPQRNAPAPRVLEGPGGPFKPPLNYRWDIHYKLLGKYGPVQAAGVAWEYTWHGHEDQPPRERLPRHSEANQDKWWLASSANGNGSRVAGDTAQDRQPATPSQLPGVPAPPTTNEDDSFSAAELRSPFTSNFPIPRAREPFFQIQVGPLRPHVQPAPRGSVQVAGASTVQEMFVQVPSQHVQVPAPRDWTVPASVQSSVQPPVQPPPEPPVQSSEQQQLQNPQNGSATQPGRNQPGSANQPIYVSQSPEPPRRNIVTDMPPPPRPPPRGGDVHEGWIQEQQQNQKQSQQQNQKQSQQQSPQQNLQQSQQQNQERMPDRPSVNAKHYRYPPLPPSQDMPGTAPPVHTRSPKRAGPSQSGKGIVKLPVVYEVHYPANPPDAAIMGLPPLRRDGERLPDQSGGQQRQTRSATNRQPQQSNRPNPAASTRAPPPPSSQRPQTSTPSGPDLATMPISLGMMRLQGGQPIAPLRNAPTSTFGRQFSPQVQQQFQQRQHNTQAVQASSSSPGPVTQQQRASRSSSGSGVQAASENLLDVVMGIQRKDSGKDSKSVEDWIKKRGGK